MECLEQISALNIKEVSEKTHISVLEIEAIIRKDFSRFNHTKAVGFTKIFKRDYNIDLTPWLEEYEAQREKEEDEIFLVPEEKEKVAFRTKLTYVLTAILVALSAFLIFSSTDLQDIAMGDVQEKEVVAEAKRQLEENKKSPQKASFVEEETQELSQETLDLTQEEPVNEITQEVAIQEVEEIEKGTVEEEIVEEVQEEPKKVALFSRQKLWVSVVDNNTKTKDSTIFQGEYPLNPEGDYTIVFGHGYFDLINNGEIIESREGDIQQYRYSEGAFVKEQYVPEPKPETQTEEESNETAVEEEETE